ncbi:hypothetical protein ACYJ80_05685 [Staphylococcus capitis]|uniref:Uncharacterized protein n=1 Tax=Staphylococcus capitis TaxID=29388 RepID=A0A7X9WBX4_STACP|nr:MULTISPECIES: hypothetical protein [Staphylococcus]AKL92844.1 hypothetical protein AYP1020_1753 [Staphylococcus capitis subsp. capitis]EEE50439.1 hypothetical protein STACA0001_0912 [Staphylococcus capitis SK14]EGS39048.1 hypothetical protein SEVCU116_1362 [Staphylococcus capitis VCU116]MBC3080402.1 hypothetical protein [Staphylococcus capitis]MBC8781278.1 hypothetical protein [Staphylococcus capitis]
MSDEKKETTSQTNQQTISEKPNHQSNDDRIGLNGYRKTDLDLDIERELREMMESGESETKTESRKFKIFSLISMIAIAGLAIFRFIHRMI